MNMFEQIGEFKPDSLIVSADFPVLKEGIGLKAGYGVLKRGSLIIKSASGGAGYIAGATAAVNTDSYSAVTPEEGNNPKTEGWYERNGDEYVASSDTAVADGKTYYAKTTTTETEAVSGNIFGILADDTDTGSAASGDNIPVVCYQTGIFNRAAVIVTGQNATVDNYADDMRKLSMFLRNVQRYE